MDRITVVGLGKMGAALAWALHHAGHDVTVWNRSSGKTQPFHDAKVAVAPDLATAVASSDVVLVCIDNYPVVKAALGKPDVLSKLVGKTLVHLSTGTPLEAADMAEWMKEQGVAYLDGAILCGPPSIGQADGMIVVSGEKPAANVAAPFLSALAGDNRYVGEKPGAAAALDLAWLSLRYGTFLSLTHAANICASEGVGVEALMAVEPDREDIQSYGAVIRDNAYHEATATLKVWAEALERIRTQANDAGINSEFPDLVADMFGRAQDAGYGQDNVMSLIKILNRK